MKARRIRRPKPYLQTWLRETKGRPKSAKTTPNEQRVVGETQPSIRRFRARQDGCIFS